MLCSSRMWRWYCISSKYIRNFRCLSTTFCQQLRWSYMPVAGTWKDIPKALRAIDRLFCFTIMTSFYKKWLSTFAFFINLCNESAQQIGSGKSKYLRMFFRHVWLCLALFMMYLFDMNMYWVESVGYVLSWDHFVSTQNVKHCALQQRSQTALWDDLQGLYLLLRKCRLAHSPPKCTTNFLSRLLAQHLQKSIDAVSKKYVPYFNILKYIFKLHIHCTSKSR